VRILVVAPQPFYQERGTPIATRLLVEVLCSQGHSVDVLTYHVGEDPRIPGVTVHRTPRVPFIRNVPIGFSLSKLVCDLLIGVKLVALARKGRYDVLHAVEEAVFLGLAARLLKRSRVVYDMDSSLVEQLLDKHRALRPFGAMLNRFERLAIARSDLVLAVCEDLAARARRYGTATPIGVLEDVSLIDEAPQTLRVDDLRADLPAGALLALYVGNLEDYQGVSLVLDALAKLDESLPLRFVVVGGSPESIEEYRARAASLGVAARVRFVGPRPVAQLGAYLTQADILVSPRLRGHNTPMKIYSYLGARKAVLATNIRSHTQVLTPDCALLTPPTAEALADGFDRLVRAPDLRERLAGAAHDLARTRYSLAQYRRSIEAAYAQLAPLH
jgi:glycosyltransferase involved in cell wall biosynthesis